MIFNVFEPTGEDLKRMRKDAGLDQKELAYLLYKDVTKRQRIGKLERGEVKPSLKEGLNWYYHCVRGVDRDQVIEAIRLLEKATLGK